MDESVTQYQEPIFTVRLDSSDIRKLTASEVEAFNKRLEANGVDQLKKIKRSNGDIEYVSRDALKQLESDRARRSQQRKLAEMRENTHYPKQKSDNRFMRALKELLK